jgi:hypothetical protein
MDGSMLETLNARATSAMKKLSGRLRDDEAAVLALLQRRLVVAKSRQGAEARRKAAAPRTVKEALRRSIRLVTQHRKAS